MALEHPCFENLPVELCNEILSIAAWDASKSNRPWLCALATTCRHTHSIVRAILYRTVCITKTGRLSTFSFRRVLALAPTGCFELTRYLWIDKSCDNSEQNELAALFPNVVHFAADLAFLENTPPAFRPVRLTLRESPLFSDWIMFSVYSFVSPALCGITHLRLAINSHDGLPDDLRLWTLSPSLRLQYVVLESRTIGWHAENLSGAVVPLFLSGANIQRLLICATSHPAEADVYAELALYAKEHRERRL